MKIPAKKLEDPSSVMMKSVAEEQVEQKPKVDCWADVYCEDVYLDNYGSWDPQYANRPLLVLTGECRAIRGDMPCGVNEISFAEGKGIPVTYFYDFTDKELAQLAEKGLFHTGFKTPIIFNDNKFELPVTCNIKAVVPEGNKDVPIVYAQIVDQHNMKITEENCGYGLAEYFEAQTFDVENKWNEPETVHVAETKVIEKSVEENQMITPEMYEPEEATEQEPVAEKSVDIVEEFVETNYDDVKAAMDERFNRQPKAESVAEESVETDDSNREDEETVLNDGHMPNVPDSDFVGTEAEKGMGE